MMTLFSDSVHSKKFNGRLPITSAHVIRHVFIRDFPEEQKIICFDIHISLLLSRLS